MDIDNNQIGRLIEFAYYLHKEQLIRFPDLPEFEYYEGNYITTGKNINSGGIWAERAFDNHDKLYALYTIIVIRNYKQEDEEILILQTNTEDYYPHFFQLRESKETQKLENEDSFYKLPLEKQYSMLINSLVFLGFKEEDVLKVINNEMTAKEAYQNIAPEEDKEKQYVCFSGRFFTFDGPVAIEGNFSAIRIDEFPFPFDATPILDCSKVSISGIHFGNNIRKVTLININERKDSIKYTNLRNAIVEEPIDASKVSIEGTTFGEQKIINLDKYSGEYYKNDIKYAYIEDSEEKPNHKIKILSNASSINAVVYSLANGAEGIGLFRDEVILEENQEAVTIILNIIENDWYFNKENHPISDTVFARMYSEAQKIYAILGGKSITFRLSDIKVNELARKARRTFAEPIRELRGVDALYNLRPIIKKEIKAIIRAAKENSQTANILIPYVKNTSDIRAMKIIVAAVAKEEEYDDFKVGAMIECQDAANIAEVLAEEADFISIGTNDLTESVLQKERSIEDLDFYILHEDVKRIISRIVHRIRRGEKTKDTPITICGEHVNNLENLSYLLSLDINSITCGPQFIESYNTISQDLYQKQKT